MWAENPAGTTDLKDLTRAFGSHIWGQWEYPWAFSSSSYAGDGNGDAASSYVDVSAYTKVSIEISEVANADRGLRAFMWDDEAGSVVTLWFHKADEAAPNYTTESAITEAGTYCVEFGKYKYLKGIKLPYGARASYTIDAAYCTPKPYPVDCTDVRDLVPGKGYTSSQWKNYLTYPTTLSGSSCVGDGNGDNGNNYMDVHEYESITFEVTSITGSCQIRFFMWDDKTSSVKTLYARPIADYEATADWTKSYAATTAGTYRVNLSGYKYLKGIKPQYGYDGEAVVSIMYATPKGITPIITTLMTGTASSALPKVDGHGWNPGTFPIKDLAQNTVLCGDGSNNGNNIADISGYNYILFAVTKATGNNFFRTWVAKSAGQNPAVTLFPHKLSEVNEVADWTAQTAITEPGLYVVNVDGYDYFNGVKTLQDWAGNSGVCDVAAMRFLTGLDELNDVAVSLSGNIYEDNTGDLATWVNWFGSMTVDATDVEMGGELFDPYALKTLKDNSIYNVTYSGAVENTNKNVAVSGTVANLALVDGKALTIPSGVTAVTAATYDRPLTAAYSTVCLPVSFSVADATIYGFTSVDGNTVTFTEVDNTIAGVPYLVKGTGAITCNGGALAAPAEGAFKGVYETVTVPAGSYGFSGGNFVKAGENVTCKPFRAYLSLASSVKSLNVNFGEEDAINSIVEDLNNAQEIYGVNGVRQNGLQKGINIIKMANGATRKVILK